MEHAGKGYTVKTALLEMADPQAFWKVARYTRPLSAMEGVKVNVVLVAPLMLLKFAPSFVLTCH